MGTAPPPTAPHQPGRTGAGITSGAHSFRCPHLQQHLRSFHWETDWSEPSPEGPAGHLHEHCLQLLTRGLFSGSSGSKRCTAGRQAASTSPSLSPPLDKAQKHSEHHRRSEALLPQLPPAQLLTAKPTTLGKHGAAPGNPHRGMKSPRCPGNSSRGQQR